MYPEVQLKPSNIDADMYIKASDIVDSGLEHFTTIVKNKEDLKGLNDDTSLSQVALISL